MKNREYNKDFFDLDSLLIPKEHINIETANRNYVMDKCIEVAKQKSIVGLIAEPGYGLNSSLELFLKRTRYKYYYAYCIQSFSIRDMLVNFIYVDLPNTISLSGAKVDDLIRAFSYKHEFDEGERSRKKLMIISNMNELTNSSLSSLIKIVMNVRGAIGILLTINEAGHKKLGNMAEKSAQIADFFLKVSWEQMEPPNPNELADYCRTRGILEDRLVTSMIKKYPTLQVLEKAVEMLIAKLREQHIIPLELDAEAQ